MTPTRRDVLKAGAGTAALGAFAGCLDVVGIGNNGTETDGYAAFFALHDWAETVGGEETTFENPVGTGRMGHGWSPDADLTPEVASTDLFFYLDTEEFSWAQNLAQNLERDYDDIRIVNLLSDLEPFMIPLDYDGSDRMPDPDYGHEYPADSVSDFDVWDLRSQNYTGYWHRSTDHWHQGLPNVLVGRTTPVGIALKDTQERFIPLGEEETYRVDAYVAGGDEDAVDIEIDGRTVEFHGKAVGEAQIVFEIYRDDELIYDTNADLATIEVVEEEMGDGEFYDPHTWVDPMIVQEMVERIADELAAYDPDNEETYRENAAEFTERVADVDRQFEEMTSSAELDVAIFAGHDSFQYVERRYGFELETPVGVSPDAQASRDDIIGLIETIDENEIETILYDPFEASAGEYPAIVDSILEESSAEYAEPLTPTEGTTEEWEENGWGWVEQMEEINIPSLEQALNPGTA